MNSFYLSYESINSSKNDIYTYMGIGEVNTIEDDSIFKSIDEYISYLETLSTTKFFIPQAFYLDKNRVNEVIDNSINRTTYNGGIIEFKQPETGEYIVFSNTDKQYVYDKFLEKTGLSSYIINTKL